MKQFGVTFILSVIALLGVNPIHAQINVTPSKLWKTEDINTTFVYLNSNGSKLEELEAVIKKNWTFSSIELISVDEFLKTEIENGCLVFLISYNHTSTTTVHYSATGSSTGATSNYVDFYLALFQKQGDVFQEISTGSLSVEGKALYQICKTRRTRAEIIYNLYTNLEIFSWNYAYLSAVIAKSSEQLVNNEDYTTAKAKRDNVSFLGLSKLYIADEGQTKQNRFTGGETKRNYQTKIDKLYDYDFEIVSKDEINKKVMN